MSNSDKNITVFGNHDQNTLDQLYDVAGRAEHVALMADGHLGYIMPIGGVAAYKGKISVPGVGFDIACGNCAVKTDVHIMDTDQDWIESLATEIQERISFGIGGRNLDPDAPVDHPLFDHQDWNIIPPDHREPLRDKARAQLGTVGAGNHYVDIFHDEEGWIWIGVHFGSRGFGHSIASAFLSLGQGGEWGERVPEREVLLDLSSDIGLDYWLLMSLAGTYAYAGREWVTMKVAEMAGGQIIDTVHNNHNFAWVEDHFGDKYVVVRKGATPAWPGQRGFVGGSMGDNAVILIGTHNVGPGEGDPHEIRRRQESALFSTVHGAGRVMSRTQARGKRHRKTGALKVAGLVTREAMMGWMAEKGVVLRGGDVDESPQAYRRLPDVLEAQGDTIQVLHILTPLAAVMAGGD